MSYILGIPDWHPATLNQFLGRHWTVCAKLKKFDRDLVAFSARDAEIPSAEAKRRVELTIVLGARQRGCDPDAYWKSLLDALVCAGMLVDDSSKWVECPPPTFERAPTKSTRIVLTDILPEPKPARKKRGTK